MSTIKKIYPNNGSILFDGGLDTKFEPTIIPDNESPDCLNVDFSYASVGTREGSNKVNSVAVGGSHPIDGLYTRHDRSGDETMCVWVNGNMYTMDSVVTMVTVPSAESIFTAGVRVGSAELENNIFFGNGGSIPYRYDGTHFFRHGVYPPASALSVSTGASGDLTGDYRWEYTFVNSNLVESDISPKTNTFAVTSKVAALSGIAVAPTSWGVSARNIYRTTSSGTTFFFVATLNDNTTTTYNDNVTDASLTVEPPTDQGVPPKYNSIVYHQSRFFMNDSDNPSYVWYTDAGEPYGTPSTNFLVVGDDTQDIVQGLGVHDNSLYIFCKVSTWILYMSGADETEWILIKSKSAFGCKSPHGIIAYKNSVIFPAIQSSKLVGFASIIGDSIKPSTTFLTINTAGSDLVSDRITPDIISINESFVGNISSIIYKDRVYYTVPHGVSQEANNRIYVMEASLADLNRSEDYSWSPWSGISISQFTIFEGELYGGSSVDGFIYKLENGTYSDNGAAINSYFWTKELSGFNSDINFSKDFRYCSLLIDTPADYNMDLTYKLDSEISDGTTISIDLTPGGSLFGTAVFGTDVFGGGTLRKDVRQFLGPIVGKRIQLKFSNQNVAGQRFKVHRMNLAYNLRGFR